MWHGKAKSSPTDYLLLQWHALLHHTAFQGDTWLYICIWLLQTLFSTQSGQICIKFWFDLFSFNEAFRAWNVDENLYVILQFKVWGSIHCSYILRLAWAFDVRMKTSHIFAMHGHGFKVIRKNFYNIIGSDNISCRRSTSYIEQFGQKSS